MQGHRAPLWSWQCQEWEFPQNFSSPGVSEPGCSSSGTHHRELLGIFSRQEELRALPGLSVPLQPLQQHQGLRRAQGPTPGMQPPGKS